MTGHDDHLGRDAHFMLAEVILLVACTNEVSNDDIIDWVQNLSQYEALSQYGFNLYNGESPNPSFESFEGPPVSFLRVRVNDPAWVKGPEDPLAPDEALVIDTTVIDIVNGLNGNVPRDVDRITFVSASPNWLFCAASHGFGDGGPGGLPTPLVGAVANKYRFGQEKLDEIKQGVAARQTGSSSVNVVILDTAPRPAYETFSGQALLTTLRSRLTVHSAASLGIEMPLPPSLGSHHYSHKDNYDMSDHGLFIAGIIHDLADTADIHLVEVLNSHGICTLYGLAQAFIKLANIVEPGASNAPLIINCSICVTFPTQPPSAPHIPLEFKINPEAEPVVLNVVDPQMALEAMRTLFALVQKMYTDKGTCVCIVAAAGNDGEPGAALSPDARYPAAFSDVIGVGATEKDGTRAWYSNQADLPPIDGLMVFGGKATRQANGRSVADAEDGILGIYIGNLPDPAQPIDHHGTASRGTASANGWAWWAGTSFATGVMSGLIASLAAGGYGIPCMGSKDLVKVFKDHKDTTTPLSESVVLTVQGDQNVSAS